MRLGGAGGLCRLFRESLTAAGADLPTLEVSGQLIVLSHVEFYLSEGVFEPTRTLELGRRLLVDGQAQGYETMRMASDLPWDEPRWWTRRFGRSTRAQVTKALVGMPVVAVCQYMRKHVSGAIVIAALRTHPLVVLGDTIHRNPFITGNLASARLAAHVAEGGSARCSTCVTCSTSTDTP